MGNLLPDGDIPSSPATSNPSPAWGGACYACSAYFSPDGSQCPECASRSILHIPGPDPDLVRTPRRILTLSVPRLSRRYPFSPSHPAMGSAAPAPPPPKKKKNTAAEDEQGGKPPNQTYEK